MSGICSKSCWVTVLQLGSRHRYAVPRIFEKINVLERLFTDSSAQSVVGRVIGKTGLAAGNPRLARLTKRIPHGIPSEKVISSDWPTLLEAICARKGDDHLAQLNRALDKSKFASKIAIRKMPRPSQIVYTFSREFQDYVSFAKTLGAKSIVDIFINPKTAWIMNESGGSGCPVFKDSYLDRERESYGRSLKMADIVLCPSDFVAGGVADMFPDVSERIRIVPYGSSIPPREGGGVPVPGRFLFVGRDLLRKGADVLSRAIKMVRDKHPHAEVVVAGASDAELTTAGIAAPGMIGLGNLDEKHLNHEYSRADAFVLPSRSEGFASVITEACSFGLPLILSPECGAPVTNGKNAIVVPSNDVIRLACAMCEILDDRAKREELSVGSRNLSAIFTEDSWGARLAIVLYELVHSSGRTDT